MRREWPSKQAAKRAGLDEASTFRRLTELRLVLPTPETASFGRGKVKFYSSSELAIARLLGQWMGFGVTTNVLDQLAAKLRTSLAETGGKAGDNTLQERARKERLFVRILNVFRADTVDVVRVTEHKSGDITASLCKKISRRDGVAYIPNRRVIFEDLSLLIAEVETNYFHTIEALKTPMEVLLNFDGCLSIPVSGPNTVRDFHTDDEIKEWRREVELCAADGNKWPLGLANMKVEDYWPEDYKG